MAVHKNFFSERIPFPDVSEDGKLETSLFLEATLDFVKIYGMGCTMTLFKFTS